MFTKKNGLMVRFVALIVMIVMVAAVGLTACADKDAQAAADNAQNTANEAVNGLAELTATINELKDALANLEKADSDTLAAIEELKNSLAEELKNNAAATAAVTEKLNELQEYVWDYDFTFYGEVEEDAAYEIYEVACYAIMRAATVAEMDEIIAGVKADFEALPTVDVKLPEVIAAIEANGVNSPEDDEAILEACDLAEQIIEGYAAAAADWKATYDAVTVYGADKVNLLTKVEKLYADWAVVYVKVGAQNIKAEMDAVIELDVTLEIAKTVEKIAEKYGEWVDLVGDDYADAVAAVKGFATSIAEFADVEARIAVLEAAKAAVEAINEEIVALQKAGVKANTASKNAIDALYAKIAAWGTTYAIVTDPAEKYYIEANHNLASVAILDAIQADFEAKVAETVAAFADFTAAVEAIGEKITPDSAAAIKAANDAYVAALKATKCDGFDDVLKVEDAKTIQEYYTELQVADAEYTGIMTHITAINNLLTTYGSIKFEKSWADVKNEKNEVVKTAAQVEAEYKNKIEEARAAIVTIKNNIAELQNKKVDGGHEQDKDAVPGADVMSKLAKIELIVAQEDAYVDINEKATALKNPEEGTVTDAEVDAINAVMNQLIVEVLNVAETAEDVELIMAGADARFANAIASVQTAE